MTTQTPDAVREAIIKYTQHYVGCAVYGSWADGEPKCSCGLDEARAALAALDSRAGDDLTPRERIARVVAWEHFGIAWHHMEKQSHANVLAMVDRMLDSRAGDAGEPVAWQWERRGRYGPTDGATIGKWERVLTPYAPDTWPEADRRNIVPLYAATPAPAVDAVPAGEVVERLKETAEDLRKIGWHKDRQNVLDAIAVLSHGEGRK